MLVFYYTPANEVGGYSFAGVGYTGVTLSVRLSEDAICPEFISNTTEQISLKLKEYLTYIM
jgi:hypothetical protein